jgi:hypothetical protein
VRGGDLAQALERFRGGRLERTSSTKAISIASIST